MYELHEFITWFMNRCMGLQWKILTSSRARSDKHSHVFVNFTNPLLTFITSYQVGLKAMKITGTEAQILMSTIIVYPQSSAALISFHNNQTITMVKHQVPYLLIPKILIKGLVPALLLALRKPMEVFDTCQHFSQKCLSIEY